MGKAAPDSFNSLFKTEVDLNSKCTFNPEFTCRQIVTNGGSGYCCKEYKEYDREVRKDCKHTETRLEVTVVGEGVHRHMVRHEICVRCEFPVAIW